LKIVENDALHAVEGAAVGGALAESHESIVGGDLDEQEVALRHVVDGVGHGRRHWIAKLERRDVGNTHAV
jgi:hypothetical protein